MKKTCGAGGPLPSVAAVSRRRGDGDETSPLQVRLRVMALLTLLALCLCVVPGVALAASVTLAWDAKTDAGLSGYTVYRSTVADMAGAVKLNATPLAPSANPTYTDSTVTRGTWYYVVTANYINPTMETGYSNTVEAVVSGSPPTNLRSTAIVAVNSGGPAVPPYSADAYFAGGRVYNYSTAVIDVSKAPMPAPMEVYRDVRYPDAGSTALKYVVPDLAPNSPHEVRLHFAESNYSAVGQRVFNILCNGAPVFANFDLIQAAGGKNRAVVVPFATLADADGKINLEFTRITGNPILNAFEVY